MFEHRLLEARKKKGWTQKQAAEAAKIHVASYSAYETNSKTPPADILLRLSEALDVSIDWLCGRQSGLTAVSTYGAAARNIIAIKKTLGDQCKLSTDYDTFGDNIISFSYIKIWDETLYAFIEKAAKFEDMSRGSADERELYYAWLEKKLAELDTMPIPQETEELPF